MKTNLNKETTISSAIDLELWDLVCETLTDEDILILIYLSIFRANLEDHKNYIGFVVLAVDSYLKNHHNIYLKKEDILTRLDFLYKYRLVTFIGAETREGGFSISYRVRDKLNHLIDERFKRVVNSGKAPYIS